MNETFNERYIDLAITGSVIGGERQVLTPDT